VKTENNLASQEATLVPFDRPSLPLSKKKKKATNHHLSESEPSSQERHLKILFSNQGFDLPNFKPDHKVSALHFL
jgi:hypothetical protein